MIFRVLVMMLFVRSADAGLLLDQSMVYFSNAITTSGANSSTHYHASFSLSSPVTKEIFMGWKSTFYGETQVDSSGTMKMTGLELGPRFGYYLGKSKWMSLSVAYLPLHSGTHTSSAGVQTKMSGSGFDFEYAIHPEVFSNLSPGFSLIYHMGTYTSATDASNTTSTVTYSRKGFYPSFYLHWKFGED